MINSNNLLVPGDYAGLYGCNTARNGEHTTVSNLCLSQTGPQRRTGRVVSSFLSRAFLTTDDAKEFHMGTESGQIRRHVCRATQTVALRLKVHDRNRRFGRQTIGHSPQVSIEHEVAKHCDVNLVKARQEPLKPGNGAAEVRLHARFGQSIINNLRFLFHHHGDFVTNWVDALASFALEPRIVWKGPHGFFANGTGEDSKQSFRNQHKALQMSERMYQMSKASASADSFLRDRLRRTEPSWLGSKSAPTSIRRPDLTRYTLAEAVHPAVLPARPRFLQTPQKRCLRMKTLSTLLLASLMLFLAPQARSQSLEEERLKKLAVEAEAKQDELQNLERETVRALQWNTGTFFRRVYSDDFVGILETGRVLDKAGYIASIENSGTKYASFVASDIRVRLYQYTAVVTCLWSARGTQGDRGFARQYRVTHVYVYR